MLFNVMLVLLFATAATERFTVALHSILLLLVTVAITPTENNDTGAITALYTTLPTVDTVLVVLKLHCANAVFSAKQLNTMVTLVLLCADISFPTEHTTVTAADSALAASAV
jgi:hypothetical protein